MLMMGKTPHLTLQPDVVDGDGDDGNDDDDGKETFTFTAQQLCFCVCAPTARLIIPICLAAYDERVMGAEHAIPARKPTRADSSPPPPPPPPVGRRYCCASLSAGECTADFPPALNRGHVSTRARARVHIYIHHTCVKQHAQTNTRTQKERVRHRSDDWLVAGWSVGWLAGWWMMLTTTRHKDEDEKDAADVCA